MVSFLGLVVTSLLALGGRHRARRSDSVNGPPSSSLFSFGNKQQHGYRPRKGAPSPPQPPSRPVVRYQVCQSPACTADGAAQTLEKMQAWAPAHVLVEAGSCVSLCGSGPIVIASSTGSSGNPSENRPETKEKRIQLEERILQLLYPEGDVPEDLIKGYQLVQRGDQAFEQKDFDKALVLYEQAVNVAFRSAVDLENERDALLHRLDNPGASSKTATRVPKGLEWLIRARRNEASCKLNLGDVDGAMLAAQASCNLSRNTSAESFLVLAEIYRLEESLEGEAQALDRAISLWNNDAVLTFPQKNQKRLAAIRLQKVQREKALTKPKITPDDLVSLQQKPELEIKKNGQKVNNNGVSKEEPSSKQETDDEALSQEEPQEN